MQNEIIKKGLYHITPSPFTNTSSSKQLESVFPGASDGPRNKSQIKTRSPNCALCRNHGKSVRTKAHKRYCIWKDCGCSKCDVTRKRRKFVASQVAARRALIQDMERNREMTELGITCDDTDSNIFSKEESCSPNTTVEKNNINSSRESPQSTSTSGSLTEHATSSGNSSSRFDCHKYLLKYSSLNTNFGFPSMVSTLPMSQLQESHYALNKLFCHRHEYPIYRILENGNADYQLGAANISEARYGPRSQSQVEESLRYYSAYEQFTSHQLLQQPRLV